MQTITTVKVNCGCGKLPSTASLAEAERHAADTGHTLHIAGEIRADRPKIRMPETWAPKKGYGRQEPREER